MSEPTILMPAGFDRRIAVTEFLHESAHVYYNQKRKMIIIYLEDAEGERLLGPISLSHLPVIQHVLKDVVEMKGAFGDI